LCLLATPPTLQQTPSTSSYVLMTPRERPAAPPASALPHTSCFPVRPIYIESVALNEKPTAPSTTAELATTLADLRRATIPPSHTEFDKREREREREREGSWR
jgi:hypothetical protein